MLPRLFSFLCPHPHRPREAEKPPSPFRNSLDCQASVDTVCTPPSCLQPFRVFTLKAENAQQHSSVLLPFFVGQGEDGERRSSCFPCWDSRHPWGRQRPVACCGFRTHVHSPAMAPLARGCRAAARVVLSWCGMNHIPPLQPIEPLFSSPKRKLSLPRPRLIQLDQAF